MAFVGGNVGLGAASVNGVDRCCRRRSGRVLVSLAGEDKEVIVKLVEKVGKAYPFPSEPESSDQQIEYDWRWHYPTAYSQCAKRAPPSPYVKILDAGCGTGLSTEHLAKLNPSAEVLGIDLSNVALEVAEKRLESRLSIKELSRTKLQQVNFPDLEKLTEGDFDMINVCGTLHGSPEPAKTLEALAAKLRPGGIMHVFVYARHGRWEIDSLMKAAEIIQGGPTMYKRQVALSKRLLRALPENNQLRARMTERLELESLRDPRFPEMFLQPHFTVSGIFDMVAESGLQFAGFSNPGVWDLTKLLGDDLPLLLKAQSLPLQEQCELVEALNPEAITHFEFFLVRYPHKQFSWNESNLPFGTARLNPCVRGFPSEIVMDKDGRPCELSSQQVKFIKALFERPAIANAMDASGCSADEVKALIEDAIILAWPAE